MHIKRFQFHNGRWIKSQRPVHFPVNSLDPMKFMTGEEKPVSPNPSVDHEDRGLEPPGLIEHVVSNGTPDVSTCIKNKTQDEEEEIQHIVVGGEGMTRENGAVDKELVRDENESESVNSTCKHEKELSDSIEVVDIVGEDSTVVATQLQSLPGTYNLFAITVSEVREDFFGLLTFPVFHVSVTLVFWVEDTTFPLLRTQTTTGTTTMTALARLVIHFTPVLH